MDRDRVLHEAQSGGPATGEDVMELAEEFVTLSTEADEMNDRLKALKKRVEHLRKRIIPEAMAQAGMVSDTGHGGVTLRDGSRVSLRTRFYASVNAADRDALHEFLAEEGEGELVKATVHPSTLRAWAKERVEQGRSLPDYVRYSHDTVASIRKGA